MKSQNVVTEVKLDIEKLYNKLKNQMISKLSMTEQDAEEQARMIAGSFSKLQTQ